MHMKRLGVSKHIPVKKKQSTYIVCPNSGPHAKKECIPLQIILRDILKYADTAKEAKKILSHKDVLVNKTIVSDHKYPVGLMDVIEIPKTKEQFNVIAHKGKLTLVEMPATKTKTKLVRILNKTTIKGGAIQLNLHDGRNITIAVADAKKSKEDKYKTGDTLIISIPDQKIEKIIEMKEGNMAMITKGKHAGVVGTIKKIMAYEGTEANKIVIETKDKKEIITLKDYAFVIGEKKSEIILKD